MFEDFSTSLLLCNQLTLLLIFFDPDMMILYLVAYPLFLFIGSLQLNQLFFHIFRERLYRFPLRIGRIKMFVYGPLLHRLPRLRVGHFFQGVDNLSFVHNPGLLVQHIIGFGTIPNISQKPYILLLITNFFNQSLLFFYFHLLDQKGLDFLFLLRPVPFFKVIL